MLPQVETEASENVIVASPQVSVAVAFPSGLGLSHSTEISEGIVKVGGVVSSIVIICVSDAVFPHSSVAVHVLVIVPVLPQASVKASENVIVTFPQESEPLALPVSAGSVLSLHSIVMSSGTVKTGAVLSSTVMVCVSETELPHSSVAVQVLEIVCVFPQPVTAVSTKVMLVLPHIS